MQTLEFGLDTFLPVTVDESGRPIGGDRAIRNAVEEAVLAEAVGIIGAGASGSSAGSRPSRSVTTCRNSTESCAWPARRTGPITTRPTA